MKLYLVIFTIFFLRIYSYETFMKTAKGKTRIVCHQNSLFVTNDTSLLNDCNLKNSCSIPENKEIQYVCVRQEFNQSNCERMKYEISLTTGCGYVGYRERPVRLLLKHRYLHLILLSKKLFTPRKILNFHSAISYLRFEHMPFFIASENCWFLWKASNEFKEDFREFFAESSEITTEDNKASFTNELSTCHVFIVVAVVVILLSVFSLAAFVIYGKRSQNKTKNDINEIPLNEYDTIGDISAEERDSFKKFNDRLDITVDNETPLYENVSDKILDEPEYMECI